VLRLPAHTSPVTYLFASGTHAIPPWFVLAFLSAPGRAEVTVPGQGHCSAGEPNWPVLLSRGCEQDLSGFQATILCLCPGPRPRPNRQSLAKSGPAGAAPTTSKAEASAWCQYRGYCGASAPAVYASRAMLPSPMQDSLPAGWLAVTGRELNPLDRYERFPSLHFFPLSWTWPDATTVWL
jgi:hypothetical protein